MFFVDIQYWVCISKNTLSHKPVYKRGISALTADKSS